MEIPAGSVWLDARATQSVDHPERGIARFVTEHIEALMRSAPQIIGAIGIDPSRPVPPSLEAFEGAGKLQPIESSPPPGETPAIYHVMSPFEASLELDEVWPGWLRQSDCRLVVTLHDLIPLVHRDLYLDGADAWWGIWGTVWMARLGLIRAADQVQTNSRQTADDAIAQLGIPEDRIAVIESGVSDRFSSLIPDRQAAETVLAEELRRLRPGFLLYVGGGDPRKNLEGTIRAYGLLPESLRAEHQLVIACRMPRLHRAGLMARARALGIRRRDLLLTGFVPDRVLAALYRSCGLFVFPSLYEGAGLPILEAMSCGAPVAASDTSSIPELLGDLEATFDPSDPGDVARCLREVLGTPGRLESLRERSRRRADLFTWDRVAERTLRGYERLIETARSPLTA